MKRGELVARASWFDQVFGFSGNNPGIQRDAREAGKARKSGARVLLETSTPLAESADTTRRALLSLVSRI